MPLIKEYICRTVAGIFWRNIFHVQINGKLVMFLEVFWISGVEIYICCLVTISAQRFGWERGKIDYTLFYKLTKTQANATQHPEAELLLFEIFHILHPRCHPKIIGYVLRNKQKNKGVCIHEIIRLIIMKMKMKWKTNHIDTT